MLWSEEGLPPPHVCIIYTLGLGALRKVPKSCDEVLKSIEDRKGIIKLKK